MKLLCLFLAVNFFVLDVSYALNDPCTTDEDCDAKEKSICLDKTCQCNAPSEYIVGLKKCLSYATEYNTLCYQDWQCEDFLGTNSQCINNACLCKTGYRWYQGKCQKYANKGEPCSDQVICLDGSSPLSLNCSGSICQCSDGYYDRGEDCRLESEENYDCAITSDCFPTADMFGVLTYSHCELGKCIKNSLTNNGTLKEFNNSFTYSQQESYLMTFVEDLEDSTTVAPERKCPNGVLSGLPEEDCLECPNTMYFKNATCICDRGFFLQDRTCMAELGMKDPNTAYQTDSECPLKPGKLVDGVCYCRNYWFQDSTNRECKKTTLEYTKNCLDNDWCLAMGPYAFCDSTTQKCQCINEAVLNETSFYCELKPDANVSKICLDNSACPLYETCRDEQCQCDDGFFRVNETSLCLPEIGYSCEVRDCGHIDNATCASNETCQCNGEDLVSNGFICVETAHNLNEECLIQEQCKNVPHSDCVPVSTAENATSQCLCTDDFLDVEGACYAVKGPGSQCSTQFNCTIILGNSFECRNNLCQCPLGKKLSTNNVCVSSSAHRLSYSAMLPVFLTVLLFLCFKID